VQACSVINREHKGINTDEAVAYAFADSTLKGTPW
jgi:hypothetical protein